MSEPVALLKLLVLLGIANGTPVFATKLFKDRFAAPLDGGLKFFDGQPLFGLSKTIRGIVLSIVCTTLAAIVVGLGWAVGATLAAASMVGDVASSFVKRRLGLKAHAQAFGLDQIPEVLLPLLLLRSRLELSGTDIVVLVATFIFLEVVLSYLLFKLRIREQPY
jgi:CDP-2,3-bis-(O-geranylgeranyl)-sn-glycerol synthase